jgi:hypothetical protein
MFIHAARSSGTRLFTWHHFGRYASRLLHEASPRAIVLVLPYICWDWLEDKEDLIQRWAAAASAIPCTKEVAQSVVDALLQIASKEELLPHIPANAWAWLTKQPPLPPVCLGRRIGTCPRVVKAIRALKDIEILKSYFLLIWSEWNDFLPENPDSVATGRSSASFDSESSRPPSIPPRPGVITVIGPSQYPVYAANGSRSRSTSISTDSVLSHHTFSGSDSRSDHPASRIPDSTSSRHIPSSPGSVLDRPPLADSIRSHRLVYIADSVVSRRASISPDSVSGRHSYSTSDGVPYRPPDSTPSRHTPNSRDVVLGRRHSFSGSDNTSGRSQPHALDNTSSRHLSISSNSTRSRRTSIGSDSMSARHSFSSSDSMVGYPLPHILDKAPSRYPRADSDSTTNRHTPNNSSSALDHLPPTDSTPSRHLIHIADSALSCHSYSSSDSHPDRPPSRVLDSASSRYSSSGSDSALSRHALERPGSLWDHHPPSNSPPNRHPAYVTRSSRRPTHLAETISSRRTSTSSGSTRSHPTPRVIGYMPSIDPPYIIHVQMPAVSPLRLFGGVPGDYLSGSLYEMQTSIQEDFGGIGMGHHRADLLQRLDHVLRQLHRGLEHLRQHNSGFSFRRLWRMKYQYQNLRETLLKTNIEAISRTSQLTITSLCMLTPVPDGHRVSRNIYVRTPSPVPIVLRPEHSVSPLPTGKLNTGQLLTVDV